MLFADDIVLVDKMSWDKYQIGTMKENSRILMF